MKRRGNKKSEQNLRNILENKILVNAVQKCIQSSNTSWSSFISETGKQKSELAVENQTR